MTDSTGMIVCCLCRKQATHALYARTGFADGPRPICHTCYVDDSVGAYYRNRFELRPLPDNAKWLDVWRIRKKNDDE